MTPGKKRRRAEREETRREIETNMEDLLTHFKNVMETTDLEVKFKVSPRSAEQLNKLTDQLEALSELARQHEKNKGSKR